MGDRRFKLTYPVKDTIVLLFYRCFSLLRLSKKVRDEHLAVNNNAWNTYIDKFSDALYIENQSELTGFLYGNRYKADYNSCEVIAVYNALVSLGNKVDFPVLLEHFERKGITFWGAFGTSPIALFNYLKTLGYNIRLYTYGKLKKTVSDENEYIDLINDYDSYIIMSYNNDKRIRDMIHTMCITKEDNMFQIHNDYEGAKCYPTLKAAIDGYNKGKSRMILVMGIGRKDTEII